MAVTPEGDQSIGDVVTLENVITWVVVVLFVLWAIFLIVGIAKESE